MYTTKISGICFTVLFLFFFLFLFVKKKNTEYKSFVPEMKIFNNNVQMLKQPNVASRDTQ